MTLKITVASRHANYQSTDFQLPDGATGEIIDNSSPKQIEISYWDWRGVIAYTGIGRFRQQGSTKVTRDWLA
jgi:hypothetical protein